MGVKIKQLLQSSAVHLHMALRTAGLSCQCKHSTAVEICGNDWVLRGLIQQHAASVKDEQLRSAYVIGCNTPAAAGQRGGAHLDIGAPKLTAIRA